jgi:CHRD domain
LELTGETTGLVAAGTATDPTLAAAILLNPENYYVIVHTTTREAGAIRGQLA